MLAQGEKTTKKEGVENEEENRRLKSFRKKSANGCGESRLKVEEPNEDGDVPDLKRSSKKVEKGERTLSPSLTEKKKKKKSMKRSVGDHASQGKIKREKTKVVKKKKKKKRMKEEEKEAAADQKMKKKKREVYDLPGQKRHPPDERDPLRIFYETLYQRLPGSEMAALWMMESGLLPLEEAKKVYKKKQKLKSPIKAVASLKRSVDSVTVEKAKAKHHDHSLSSPALSVKKSVVVESKSVSMCKESSKRKSRDGDGDTWENERDDFHLAKKKTKKLKDGT